MPDIIVVIICCLLIYFALDDHGNWPWEPPSGPE